MKLNDYSSLESYAKGLFDAFAGLPMADDKNLSESYLEGFNTGIQHQLDNPMDIKDMK
jgi:hypothetical protein